MINLLIFGAVFFGSCIVISIQKDDVLWLISSMLALSSDLCLLAHYIIK